MTAMNYLEIFFLKRYRRRLLKALAGPFGPVVSHRLEAVDALLGAPRLMTRVKR